MVLSLIDGIRLNSSHTHPVFEMLGVIGFATELVQRGVRIQHRTYYNIILLKEKS
jgi:hypothetical protein